MSKLRKNSIDETRSKLIKAARHSFAERGYADSSMDDLTAKVGLTRGALYHNFGSKEGLLEAVINEIDSEMHEKLKVVSAKAKTKWDALIYESIAYIEMALEPEIQRIVLLDGPAVLGDPSKWENQNACLVRTANLIQEMIEEGIVVQVNPEAAARLLNGASLNAALWIASSSEPRKVLKLAIEAYRLFASGLLKRS